MFDPSKIKRTTTLGSAFSIGLAMVLAIAIGFGLGLWVDNTWPSLAPWGKIVGLGLGIVSAYRNLFIMIRRIQKEMDKNERQKSG